MLAEKDSVRTMSTQTATEILATNEKFAMMTRFLNLIFIVNATLFVSTRLVLTHGYWWCLLANGLVIVNYGLILRPKADLRDCKLYRTTFAITLTATFLTVASILYWYYRRDSIQM